MEACDVETVLPGLVERVDPSEPFLLRLKAFLQPFLREELFPSSSSVASEYSESRSTGGGGENACASLAGVLKLWSVMLLA